MNRVKRLVVGLAAASVMTVGAVTLSVPVEAGTCSSLGCGRMQHMNDDGYDAAIITTCDWALKPQTWVYENNWSPCQDTDGIYTRPGDVTACRFLNGVYGWQWVHFSAGWQQFRDGTDMYCVSQKA